MKKFVFLILVIVLLASYMWISNLIQREIASVVYADINMDLVANGTYIGETKVGPVFVKLEVTVQDKVINNIEIIEHQKGLGGKAESIIEEIIAKNSYDVEAISGATVSSEAIKSAVNKALKRARQ
ncbi:MAG TPA: FMN-binding protein [Halanaerobiales bacterium]|nr:FMN-binding protein [Halanaerobiales bacterium]HQD03110.1 FMN-binding protein [Halanaerobiales bacterium]